MRLTDAQIEMLAWLQRAGPMPRAYLAGPALDKLLEAGFATAASEAHRLGAPASAPQPRIAITAEGARALASATVFDASMTDAETLRRHRGVRNPCPKCSGWGVRWYGSGSTWRGGMGTASCTQDVCGGDGGCWGSGDADAPWPSWAEERARVERGAAERLDAALGVLPGARDALAEFLGLAVRAAERRDARSLGVCQARALLGLLRGGKAGV